MATAGRAGSRARGRATRSHLARHSLQFGLVLAAASLVIGHTNPAAARPLLSEVTRNGCCTKYAMTHDLVDPAPDNTGHPVSV